MCSARAGPDQTSDAASKANNVMELRTQDECSTFADWCTLGGWECWECRGKVIMS